MARNFDGATQYFKNAGSTSSPVQQLPCTLIIDFQPNSASNSIPISLLSSSPTSAGGFEGWYVFYSASTVSATTATFNAVFNGSGSVPCSQGTRHLVSAVFRSATNWQVYCDGQAGSIASTSTTPAHTPNILTVGAATHGTTTDNFCAANIWYAGVWPFALDFQQHIQLWQTGYFNQGGPVINAEGNSQALPDWFYKYDFNNTTSLSLGQGFWPAIYNASGATNPNVITPTGSPGIGVPSPGPWRTMNAAAPNGITASGLPLILPFNDSAAFIKIIASVFSKTLSQIGGRIGTRQIQGWGS